MKKILVATVFAASALYATSAFALASGGMGKNFGTVYSVPHMGHDMQIQGVKDSSGEEFVIVTRKDFETMMGHPLTGVMFRDLAGNN
jgi:hypothetical protein